MQRMFWKKVMDSNCCMSESEKYKAKIKKLIQDKSLCS